MVVKEINVILDIDDHGIIQGYQVFNTKEAPRFQDPELERLCSGKQIFNCPTCQDTVELVMYLSGLAAETIDEPATVEPFQVKSEWDIDLIEHDDATDQVQFVLEEVDELIDDGMAVVEIADDKICSRDMRIAKEQLALANEEFKCDKCSQCFMYKVALMNHEKKCQNLEIETWTPKDVLHRCDKCNQTFRSKAGMRSHEKTCIGNAVAVCIECNVQYSSQLALNKHIRAVHQPTFYRCPECGDQ